ncbi:MAG UNVERIFIED_CONTAM: DUF2924 domain-containing protein [Planctomycetaceae bacterium]
MMPELATEVQRMAAMTVGQLQDRYAELWKHAPRSRNRTWLTRKIAWRLQMLAESGLSQRARDRATASRQRRPAVVAANSPAAHATANPRQTRQFAEFPAARGGYRHRAGVSGTQTAGSGAGERTGI